jgi:fumarate hydratase class II
MPRTRKEKDSLGVVEVPADRLWGAQTQRSLRYFRAGAGRDTLPRSMVRALGLVKKAAALANAELGLLDPRIARAVVRAADEVIRGKWDGEFPLVVWQTGSGTQSNMNANEVIANRACSILHRPLGVKAVHPNDHVNLSQSSNDAFPTAMHVAAAEAILQDLIPSARALQRTLAKKAEQYRGVVKIGRTHLMDAVPLTLGQEISGWAAMIANNIRRIETALPGLYELALGGTAVGTGLNAPRGFAVKTIRHLCQMTRIPFVPAPNKFEALAGHDALVFAHASLRSLAVSLFKISNDVRWLASGPRSGLGEITIPSNEPGSSIMPGKINPTQSEALMMICAQVMGNDTAVSLAGASGNFELNTMKPLIIHNVLMSAGLLAAGCAGFDRHCASGIRPNTERIADHLDRSLMLATALTPHIGYDAAAKIALKAHREGTPLRTAALALGTVSEKDFDRWVDPKKMSRGGSRA